MNSYSELFLKDLKDLQRREKIFLFLPLGTLEWHGAYLPLGSDLIVALEITKRIAKNVGGIFLPPLYLGTDTSQIKRGMIFSGMDIQLNKKLEGSIYYLKPKLFYFLLDNLISQIKLQGFKKLIIISGHGAMKQREVLKKIKKNLSSPDFKILLIDPYQMIKQKYELQHAGWEEISLLWALRPDLIKKSKKANLNNEDIIRFCGEDPRKKASRKMGREILKYIIKKSLSLISKL